MDPQLPSLSTARPPPVMIAVFPVRNVKKLEDAKEELERLYGVKVLAVQADVNAGAETRQQLSTL